MGGDPAGSLDPGARFGQSQLRTRVRGRESSDAALRIRSENQGIELHDRVRVGVAKKMSIPSKLWPTLKADGAWLRAHEPSTCMDNLFDGAVVETARFSGGTHAPVVAARALTV
jgi:hypothetical protein